MVRICNVKTFACATILVAGTVASAADKTQTAGPVKADQPAAQMSLRQAVTNWQYNSNSLGLGGGCSCLWFNGAFDGRDGQASHLGGGVPCGAKAADDFHLCEGFVYELRSISGTLLTNSNPAVTKARLELYDDCNGHPNNLLYTFTEFTKVEGGAIGNGFRQVDYTFTIANQTDVANRLVRLKGGCYWVSLIGLTDGQCPTMNMCDASYFATTGNGVVKGSVAQKIFGICSGYYNVFRFEGPWSSVQDCCIGCTDLAFTVCADSCKILLDNGDADSVSVPAGSRSQKAATNVNARSADDFVVNPCHDFRICYIEGCIYTNCTLFTTVAEIYGNDCNLPSGCSPLTSFTANKIVDLHFTVVIDGRTLHAYRAEFHGLNYTLTKAQHYWISLAVQATYNLNERAYFCFNADCRRPNCLIRFNPGVFTDFLYNGTCDWVSVGRDFSFLIAGDSVNAGGSNSTPSCRADFNADGLVTVTDIFSFIGAWFAGCP